MNNLFKKSIKKYKKTQDFKYQTQKLSNEIRSKSKKATALLRRNNIKESENEIKECENLFKLINKISKKNRELLNQSFYKEAVEEYIEALTFYNFLTQSKRKKLSVLIKVEPEEIISGTCDFTGEIVRKAITIGSIENLKQLVSYKKVIENIAEELTKIGFQGKLRQKYDEVERNLRKMENILYDIKLKK